MFCSKHSITLENTYLISCWFHCIDELCIKFIFYETFRGTNSVTRILLIETLFNFRTIKYCFTLYLHMYHVCFRLVWNEMFSISRLAFLRFPFHWYLQILNFIVLSIIIAHHSALTPQISKNHLPIPSANVRELELNWYSKDQSRKMGRPPAWKGAGSPTPLQNLKIY